MTAGNLILSVIVQRRMERSDKRNVGRAEEENTYQGLTQVDRETYRACAPEVPQGVE